MSTQESAVPAQPKLAGVSPITRHGGLRNSRDTILSCPAADEDRARSTVGGLLRQGPPGWPPHPRFLRWVPRPVLEVEVGCGWKGQCGKRRVVQSSRPGGGGCGKCAKQSCANSNTLWQCRSRTLVGHQRSRARWLNARVASTHRSANRGRGFQRGPGDRFAVQDSYHQLSDINP